MCISTYLVCQIPFGVSLGFGQRTTVLPPNLTFHWLTFFTLSFSMSLWLLFIFFLHPFSISLVWPRILDVFHFVIIVSILEYCELLGLLCCHVWTSVIPWDVRWKCYLFMSKMLKDPNPFSSFATLVIIQGIFLMIFVSCEMMIDGKNWIRFSTTVRRRRCRIFPRSFHHLHFNKHSLNDLYIQHKFPTP